MDWEAGISGQGLLPCEVPTKLWAYCRSLVHSSDAAGVAAQQVAAKMRPGRSRRPHIILANLAQYAIIARMLARRIEGLVRDRLGHMPAVALLGPRQVGKAKLAHAIADGRKSVYLDLESYPDREKLTDAAFYLSGHVDDLVVLDEVQRVPELFATLRGLIRPGPAAGEEVRPLPASRFCIGRFASAIRDAGRADRLYRAIAVRCAGSRRRPAPPVVGARWLAGELPGR